MSQRQDNRSLNQNNRQYNQRNENIQQSEFQDTRRTQYQRYNPSNNREGDFDKNENEGFSRNQNHPRFLANQGQIDSRNRNHPRAQINSQQNEDQYMEEQREANIIKENEDGKQLIERQLVNIISDQNYQQNQVRNEEQLEENCEEREQMDDKQNLNENLNQSRELIHPNQQNCVDKEQTQVGENEDYRNSYQRGGNFRFNYNERERDRGRGRGRGNYQNQNYRQKNYRDEEIDINQFQRGGRGNQRQNYRGQYRGDYKRDNQRDYQRNNQRGGNNYQSGRENDDNGYNQQRNDYNNNENIRNKYGQSSGFQNNQTYQDRNYNQDSQQRSYQNRYQYQNFDDNNIYDEQFQQSDLNQNLRNKYVQYNKQESQDYKNNYRQCEERNQNHPRSGKFNYIDIQSDNIEVDEEFQEDRWVEQNLRNIPLNRRQDEEDQINIPGDERNMPRQFDPRRNQGIINRDDGFLNSNSRDNGERRDDYHDGKRRNQNCPQPRQNQEPRQYQNKYQHYFNEEEKAYERNQLQRGDFENNRRDYNFNNQKNRQNYNQYNEDYEPFQFKCKFPRLPSYNNILDIRALFKSLSLVNQMKGEARDYFSPGDQFFLIRPNGLENLHKAIKYGIWTSLGKNNTNFMKAYNLSLARRARVFLIFAPIYSASQRNQFQNLHDVVGVAKMISTFDKEKHFKYWDKPNLFFGLIRLSWEFVKSISFSLFPSMEIQMENNNIVEFSLNDLKDGATINYEDAISIMQIFIKSQDLPSVFQEFSCLDKQEDQIRDYRNNNNQFEREFKEKTIEFEQNFVEDPKICNITQFKKSFFRIDN